MKMTYLEKVKIAMEKCPLDEQRKKEFVKLACGSRPDDMLSLVDIADAIQALILQNADNYVLFTDEKERGVLEYVRCGYKESVARLSTGDLILKVKKAVVQTNTLQQQANSVVLNGNVEGDIMTDNSTKIIR